MPLSVGKDADILKASKSGVFLKSRSFPKANRVLRPHRNFSDSGVHQAEKLD